MATEQKQNSKSNLQESVKDTLKPKRFKFKTSYALGIAFGLFFLAFTFVVLKATPLFVPFLGLSLVLGTFPMWMDYFSALRRERELEAKFPEFVRNLVEAIKSGLTVSAAVQHVSQINYGTLTPHVRKMANQITWSVPLHKALAHFANSTGNRIIKRAIATVIEAKESGGSLEEVLETITTSVVEIKKIKDKRRANIFSQIMQNYFIFFVFIGVMVVIQNVLMPFITGLGTTPTELQQTVIERTIIVDMSSVQGFVITFGQWFLTLNGIFIMIAMIQGLFAGIVIGKLSEGNIKYGFKHSFILIVIGFTLMSLTQGLAG